MEQLLDAARGGDPSALHCMEETMAYLEQALSTLYNLYDPELVVLGGPLFPYLADGLSAVRRNLQRRRYSFVKDKLRLMPCSFGRSQSAVGAASLVYGRLLQEPLRLLEQHPS